MVRFVLPYVLASLASGAPPPHQESAAVARWMVNKIDWGIMSTLSTRTEASHIGDAFGNPQSHADANNGVPYFFVSNLDASIVDVNVSSRMSFAMSEAQLTGDDTVADCTIADGGMGDPENPTCARLVLSGNFVKVDEKSDEGKEAKKALIKKHPSFRRYPPGHDFFVAKLDIDGIWLIDFYGGAANIAPKDYYAANLTSFERPMQPAPLSSPPPAKDKVATARWMASTLKYGALSTLSTRSEASTVGDPFGNPQSFADVNGVPHIWASMLDASMVDLFSAEGANPRASLALSEASLAGTSESVKACTIGSPLGDPENPPCARLVLSGNMVKLDVNTSEGAAAKEALFERHPAFASYPQSHDFLPVKMDLDGIWLIDQFGGAAIIDPKDYLAGAAAITV